jgi:hypothetical protein
VSCQVIDRPAKRLRFLDCGLGWAILWLLPSATTYGDLLWLNHQSATVSGLLLEENSRGITFRVRRASGEPETRFYPAAEILRVVRTVNLEILTTLPQMPAVEGLHLAETWLAIPQDDEAAAQGQLVLRQLLGRDDLEPELRVAVERLLFSSLRPGLTRERLWRQAVGRPADRPVATTPVEPPAPPDAWEWYAARLTSATRVAWLEAIREDRRRAAPATPDGRWPSSPENVPRSQLQAAIRPALEATPAEDPLHAWISEVAKSLAADDVEALLTVMRLELACLSH